MTSLNENLFFRTLTRSYKKRYQEIIDNCYHVCVPINGSYEPKQLNDKFITSHILKPSPLLKSHFLPYNNKQNFHVQIDGQLIKVTKGFGDQNHYIVRILSEEQAYNNTNKRYSIFLCEKPLISSLNCKLNYESFDVGSRDIELVSFEDCKRFLCSISKEEVEKLTNEMQQLIKTYIILPDYLSDVALKLKRIIDSFISSFSAKIPNEKINLYKNNKELICSTVESYSIGLIYDHLMSMIKKKMCKDDEMFLKKTRNLVQKSHLKPTDFGAQKVFEKFTIPDDIILKFKELENHNTPLSKLNCMRQTLDLINDQLKKTVDDHKSPFDFHTEKIYIMSDDLIAAVICVLAVCEPSAFCSTIEFIHMFSWYLPQNSELGYSLVTFEVVKEYIVNFDQNSILDNKSRNIRNNVPACTSKINYLNNEFSSLDREIDKITEMIGNSGVCRDQSGARQHHDSEELGGFLGSLASDFMAASGKKY